MTIDQIIAAQDANEVAARRNEITFVQFKAEQARLEKLRTHAMAQINARIAAQTPP